MELLDRASKYLSKMAPSVSGSGGHNACFAAAVAMVKGFSLPDDVAYGLLMSDYNPRCAPPWNEREMRHKIAQAARANNEEGYLLGNDRRKVTMEEWKKRRRETEGAIPAEAMKKGQEIDNRAVLIMSSRERIDEAYLLDRSPIDIATITTPEAFLGELFEDGERVLVFTNERTQGDFGFHVAKGESAPGRSYRLGDRPGVKPRAESIPTTGRLGVWMLANPVDGVWKPNGTVDRHGRPITSRRSGPNVTAWRFLLLESDDLPPEQWLNIVANLPLPIAAIYTSGGRSVHVLVRLDARTQDELRQAAEIIGPVLAKLGGDWKALSSVRLTRLPCCAREGKMADDGKGGKSYRKFPQPEMQRLLWLDPDPEVLAIASRPKLRTSKSSE
jgi:hypothetical protein